MTRRIAPTAATDPQLNAWRDAMLEQLSKVGRKKFADIVSLLKMRADDGASLEQLREQLPKLQKSIASPLETNLFKIMVMLGNLKGRLATQESFGRVEKMNARRDPEGIENSEWITEQNSKLVANADSGLFGGLRFVQAINALADRIGLAKDAFLLLDAAARSKAFTMANVADEGVLAGVHKALSAAIENGETYRDFEKRLKDLQEESDWTGTSPNHYRLVYDTNVGMAYTAGRYQQGADSGLRVWEYLPSLSDHPRPDHEQYVGQLFRADPGKPMPPWDFNCGCGWEWKLPEELEGIDVDALPVFDPPVPESGFIWSPSDYVSTNMSTAKQPLLILNSVEVMEASPEILILPWGTIKRTDGTEFLFTANSAQQVLDQFSSKKLDLVIDYEHHTVGGKYAAPDGKAKAGGWIKQLKTSQRGLVANVEWTPVAAKEIASRQYRYLSPVALLDPETLEVQSLHSVALVNKPAIVGSVPLTTTTAEQDGSVKIVNKQSAAADAALLQRSAKMDEMQFVSAVRQIMENSDLPAEQKLAQIMEAVGKVNTSVNKLEPLLDAAKELGSVGEPLVAAINKGDVAGLGKSLSLCINRLKNPVGMVPAKNLEEASQRIASLEQRLADQELNALISVNAGRLTPAEESWFRDTYRKDADWARKWLENKPMVVNKEVPAQPIKSDRTAMINSAKQAFTEEKNSRMVLCSERAWVDTALCDAGMAVLSDEDVVKHSIVDVVSLN